MSIFLNYSSTIERTSKIIQMHYANVNTALSDISEEISWKIQSYQFVVILKKCILYYSSNTNAVKK